MEIRYEISKAHICHNNVCFKTSFVLIRNMTDKAILGLLFISLLYSFSIQNDGIICCPFDETVKFEFLDPTQNITLLKEDSISKNIS